MGRLQTYIGILIMLELLFVITGQLCSSASSCSLTSILFSMVINPSSSTFSNWFQGLLGNPAALISGSLIGGGILTLLISRLVLGGVSASALFTGLTSDSVLFAGTGVALALIVGDFVAIYTYLASYNQLAALIIMSPMCILYILTVLEWVRGIP